ncbi:MAG: hypothetical protein ACI9FB_001922 [Candidatus Azotimanducaceae bacterium]|jgi:hypothetical protein
MMHISFQPKIVSTPIVGIEGVTQTKSCFAFSFGRAGSTLMFDMLRAVSSKLPLSYFSIEDELYSSGRYGVNRPKGLDFSYSANGVIYGGFRKYPSYEIKDIDLAKAVWLVRDPRDMMVSRYFSLVYSHAAPTKAGVKTLEKFYASRVAAKKIEINRFVLQRQIVPLAKEIESYYARAFPSRSNVRIYRYEDVIFDKARWLADMCDWLEIKISMADIESITSSFNQLPSIEAPNNHIRKVTPGKFREHLLPATIKRIEGTFAEFMNDFEYLD